jgi:hypothetical protein
MKTICKKLPFFGNFLPLSPLRPRFQPVGNIGVYDKRILGSFERKTIGAWSNVSHLLIYCFHIIGQVKE